MHKLRSVGAVCLVMATVLGVILTGWASAYYFEGYPTNGPFQVLNPLARMLQGQLPGRDFPLFHGLLLQWTMLPSFLLLGKNLFASEWTRQVLPPVTAGLSLGMAAYALTHCKHRATLFAVACVALGVTMQNSERASLLMISHLVTAGNSLISYRAALPLLLIASWGVVHREKELTTRSFVALGALIGLAPVWSYEQGVYAFSGLLVMGLYYLSLNPRLHWKPAALSLMVALGVTVLSFSLITAGHGVDALSYAFGTIPKDQGWYFGAAPNRYLVSPELVASPTVLPFFGFAFISAAFGACALYFHRIKCIRTPQALVALFLAWQGIICLTSLAGMVTPAYAIPSIRAILLLGFALCVWGGRYLMPPLREDLRRVLDGCLWMASSILGGLVLVSGLRAPAERGALPQFAKSVPSTELGVTLSEKYYKDVDQEVSLYKAAPGRVFSMYVGPTDHIIGQSNPSSVDYIIHALGDERRSAYLETLKRVKPRYVTTMRRSFFVYEQWLQYSSWPVYQELVANYQPKLSSAYRIIWERAQPVSTQPVQCSKKENSPVWMTAATPSDKTRLYALKVRYTVSNPWSRIPLLGTLARLEMNFSSPTSYAASLPLNKTEWTVPIVVRPGQPLNLVFTQAALIPRFMADVDSMELCELAIPEERIHGLDDLAPGVTEINHPNE